ncbi:MAG: septum formation initiator family protein [Sphingomonadaceae bacterium]
MAHARSTSSLIKAAAAPAAAILIVAHFAGFALFGPNGLLAWGDYKRDLAVKTVQLQRIEAKRAELSHRVALLDPRKVDPDYADELVRRETGQVRPDEVIIPIR